MASANIDCATYVSKLVGTPWERHGLHCWRVVARIQRDLFGREVPFSDHEMVERNTLRGLMGQEASLYGWREIPDPVHGAVVRMYRVGGNPHDLEHAGVFLALGAGVVVHSDKPYGVVPDTLLELKTRGWMPRFFVPNT